MRYVSDLIGAIRDRQATIAKSLVSGNAVTFEAYQRLVGQHQGLEEVLEIINDLLKDPDDESDRRAGGFE
mgnify:CR=1 FL=1|jgi:hypothetical protein